MVQTNKTPDFNITNKLLHQYITHQISHSAAQHNSDVHTMSILSLSTNPKKKNIIFRAKIIAQSKTRPNQPKPISLQQQKKNPIKISHCIETNQTAKEITNPFVNRPNQMQ